jgi:hypothetical protein
MPMLSRLYFRILDRSKKLDYLWLLLICSVSIVLSVLLGFDRNMVSEIGLFQGYLVKTNFWPLAFIIPLFLWILRVVMMRMANLNPPELPDNPPAIISLLPTEDARKRVYQSMRKSMSAPGIMVTVIVMAVMITVLDTLELLGVYLLDHTPRPEELDWSVMYLTGMVPKWLNALFCLSAYTVQFLITFVGCCAFVFVIRHNIFFLNRVYQRRNVAPGEEANYIHIDLNDVNKCFGFRNANNSFNTQVIVLIIAGLAILISRVANVSSLDSELTLTQIFSWPSPLFQISSFPDVGQWLVGLFWLFGLLLVSMPAAVKLLPRLPIGKPVPNLSITTYLREFFDDSVWKFGDQPSNREIDELAAKFADNSFWPTGDNRASQLFFFSAIILLVIMYPLRTSDPLLLLLSIILIVAMAWGIKEFLFFLLNSSLSFVDQRLATQRPELIAALEGRQVRFHNKLFISYRREDSSAYTRLLRQSLTKYMKPTDIFMDVETIRDGADFINVIEESVRDCEVMLVVIGKHWLSASSKGERNRLFEEEDFVRREIALGLQSTCLVVPVLVGGAEMPGEADLPEEIQALWRRNARKLSDDHWEYDVESLIKSL